MDAAGKMLGGPGGLITDEIIVLHLGKAHALLPVIIHASKTRESTRSIAGIGTGRGQRVKVRDRTTIRQLQHGIPFPAEIRR